MRSDWHVHRSLNPLAHSSILRQLQECTFLSCDYSRPHLHQTPIRWPQACRSASKTRDAFSDESPHAFVFVWVELSFLNPLLRRRLHGDRPDPRLDSRPDQTRHRLHLKGRGALHPATQPSIRMPWMRAVDRDPQRIGVGKCARVCARWGSATKMHTATWWLRWRGSTWTWTESTRRPWVVWTRAGSTHAQVNECITPPSHRRGGEEPKQSAGGVP